MVIQRLQAAGADIRKPTDIRFYLYFPDSAGAVDSQLEVLSHNYLADVSLPWARLGQTEISRDFGLIVSITAAPSIDTISAMQSFLTAVADRHGGHYDGWKAAVNR